MCSALFPFSFPLPFSFSLSIVQVRRITSVWPRTPFRPLFPTIQTASLLSSHPFEAAMFGVAGAMYYLCERALTSRWKSSKVGLVLLVLGILLLCLWQWHLIYCTLQELTASMGHFASDHWFQSFVGCIDYTLVSTKRKITLKGQQTQNAAFRLRACECLSDCVASSRKTVFFLHVQSLQGSPWGFSLDLPVTRRASAPSFSWQKQSPARPGSHRALHWPQSRTAAGFPACPISNSRGLCANNVCLPWAQRNFLFLPPFIKLYVTVVAVFWQATPLQRNFRFPFIWCDYLNYF